MNRIALALAVFAALSMPNLADAKQCRDAHGKFIKCPPAASPSPHATRCRDAKGKFVRCGTPGSHPA